MLRSNFNKQRSGVTLVEMLIGVAVLGVLLAVAVPSLTGMMERRRVVATAGEIASFFAQGRSESAVTDNKVSLHMERVPAAVGEFSCLRLTTHRFVDTCTCNRRANDVCSVGDAKILREFILPRSSSVRFEATATGWGFDHYAVTFQRGTYPTDVKNLMIVVTGIKTNAQLRVEYNNAGRVRTCSPDGSIGGFPAC
ncbi:Tfp pilus assembly protein FimT/FimU [Roseateles sp. DXS20W]|uniref:Tfp pilus assembly protein FimT/FimU n=1 Tax=Pelomonas lactea TaxID=3299030 RepID=A0ABW7GH53_9BURK